MVNVILSLILGMLPEVLFLTLYLIFSKNIKKNKLKLFILLILGYVTLIMLIRYKLVFYLAYIVYAYLILKILYKSEIIDFFVTLVGYSYLTLISLICFKLINNYYVAYIIDRFMLFIPFIFNKYFNAIYLKYKGLWNRNDIKKRKIKSLTVRNISLLLLNFVIIGLNLILIYIIAIIS